jgi:hypothetical protein
MSTNTADYNGNDVIPPPISETVQKYLRQSISLADVLKRIAQGWTMAAAGAALGVVVGLYVVWITPPTYTVTVTLRPLEDGSADLTGGGGTGLAALAGLLGSSGPVPKFTRFVAAFYTTSFAEYFDKRFDVICQPPSCDPKTRQWRPKTGLVAWGRRAYAAIAHLPNPDRPQTAADLSTTITNNLTITPDKNTHMLALSMDDANPKRTSAFLVHLVQAANDYIKNQDNEMVQKQVTYVTQQLKTNTDLSQRDVLTRMLSDAEQHLMLTAIDLPYVATIEDGPTVTTINKSVRYVPGFILLGLLLGGGLSLLPRHMQFWRGRWTRS